MYFPQVYLIKTLPILYFYFEQKVLASLSIWKKLFAPPPSIPKCYTCDYFHQFGTRSTSPLEHIYSRSSTRCHGNLSSGPQFVPRPPWDQGSGSQWRLYSTSRDRVVCNIVLSRCMRLSWRRLYWSTAATMVTILVGVLLLISSLLLFGRSKLGLSLGVQALALQIVNPWKMRNVSRISEAEIKLEEQEFE